MAIEQVELELPEVEELETPFKRRVALLVVFITLFGAVVAYLESQSSTREDIAVRDAQRSAISGLGLQIATSAETTYDFGVYAEAQQYERRKIVAASQARLIAQTPQGQAFQAESERWARVKSAIAPLAPLLSDTRYSDENEELFKRLQRFETDKGVDPDVATLRQAAEGEKAEKWSSKSSRYVAILTLLAVSLFLLGLSLTIGGAARFVFVMPALVIVAWCGLNTGILVARIVPATNDEVIRDVAEGNRLTAQSEYDEAIQRYSDAIRLRPDYATAYGQRAEAHFLKGNTQTGRQFVSVTDPENLKDAIADGEKAIKFGAENDINVVGNLGFNYFLDHRYPDAEDLTKQALKLNDSLPSVWLNLGVIRAAQGDAAGANSAYSTGVVLINARPDVDERTDLYAAGRTDLEILAREQPNRIDLVHRFQTVLARGEALKRLGEGGGGSGGPTVDNFSFTPSGATLLATFDYDGIEPDSHVAYLWFHRPDDTKPYVQLPEMNTFDTFAGSVAGTTDVSGTPGPCPIPGQYRLDVYVDGELAGSGDTTLEPGQFGLLVPYQDEILGVTLCRPQDWQVEATQGDSFTVAAPDGTIAVGVSAIPVPAEFPDDKSVIEQFAVTSAGGGNAPLQPFHFGGVDGVIARFTQPDGTRVAVAASAGDDRQLRVALVLAQKKGVDDPVPLAKDILDTLFFRV